MGSVEIDGKVVDNVVEIGVLNPLGLRRGSKIEVLGRTYGIPEASQEWFNGPHDAVDFHDFPDNSDGNGGWVRFVAPEGIEIQEGGNQNGHTHDGATVTVVGATKSGL